MINFMLLFDLPMNTNILFHVHWPERNLGPILGGESVDIILLNEKEG